MNQMQKKKKQSNENQRIKRNLLKKIKEEAIEPIESWTLHGLPNVFRTKYKSIKIIWIILFLAALGISIYFLYNTINEYLQYNVTTVVRIVNVEEMDLPVITFCDKNFVNNQNGLDYYVSILNQIGYAVDLEGLTNYIDFTGRYLVTYWPSVFFYQIPIKERINYSKTLNEILYHAFFDRFINPEEFNWIFHPYLGNCYQLNTDSQFKAEVINFNVLQMSFNLKLPPIVENYGYGNGLIVFFEDKKSNIYRLNQQDSYVFKSGFQTSLRITKSVFNRYPKPYSDCDFIEDDDGNFEYPSSFDRKYYDQIKQAGYQYSQSMCISFCQLDKIGNNCTFRASSLNAPNNMNNFCPDIKLNFVDSPDLLDKYLLSYYYNKETDNECKNKCPLECKTEKYEISFENTEENEPNHFLELFINFNSFSYLNYEESPSISVYGLVSNVGGAIGLLLGMSLLSIFEVLEMVILSIVITIQHKYRSFKSKREKPKEFNV